MFRCACWSHRLQFDFRRVGASGMGKQVAIFRMLTDEVRHERAARDHFQPVAPHDVERALGQSRAYAAAPDVLRHFLMPESEHAALDRIGDEGRAAVGVDLEALQFLVVAYGGEHVRLCANSR